MSRPPPIVVQLFDRTGFYSAVTAETEEAVTDAVVRRCQRVKGLVACSVPFNGKWVAGPGGGSIADVSLPLTYKEELADVDKPNEETA